MKTLLDKAKDTARELETLARTGIDDAKGKGEELIQRRQLDHLARELGHVTHRMHRGEEGLEPERDRLLLAMDGARAAMGEAPEDLIATVGLDA